MEFAGIPISYQWFIPYQSLSPDCQRWSHHRRGLSARWSRCRYPKCVIYQFKSLSFYQLSNLQRCRRSVLCLLVRSGRQFIAPLVMRTCNSTIIIIHNSDLVASAPRHATFKRAVSKVLQNKTVSRIIKVWKGRRNLMQMISRRVDILSGKRYVQCWLGKGWLNRWVGRV